ncbi:endonuclease/exonuclease/phosphatase family protein [Patiriisocius sp. Uisw_047]|uniref:endonuclease/exonuclease/phosphatase family protein n=1 Tax=Patiriisocius sp. Uisw_047 TaxID=3230969 RepID=UPI0039EB7531
MRFLLFFLLIPFASMWSQTIEDLDFGTEGTLDIVTWNIEFFPKNDQTTLQYVVEIIEAIDADIIAIQEVDDYFYFNDLIDFLSEYDGYYQSSNSRGLAYLYKSDIISINAAYELFIAPPESDNFPRYPMVLDIDYYQERVVLINNHYKCCGDGELELDDDWDEETRRYNANLLLKNYIDNEFTNTPVVLLGDLNDILTDVPEDNVFQNFLDDSSNYQFVDFEIATGPSSNFSYPSWPSHIDHILITKELFLPFMADGGGVETIKIDEFLAGGFTEYDQNVSDHRPVGMRVVLPQILSAGDIEASLFVTAKNPMGDILTLYLNRLETELVVEIYTTLGRLVYRQKVQNPGESLALNASQLSEGLFIAIITNADHNRNIIKLKK